MTQFIGDLLTEFRAKPPADHDLPVLTLTEKNGFVRQSDRFNKRLATEDTSSYKVVERLDLAFNPYLLWAGAVAQNTIVNAGVISPLYPTFRIKEGHDPRFVARLLLSHDMIAKYDSISFGSVPRRRRAATKDFLGLPVPPVPPIEEQRRIAAILDQADTIRTKFHKQGQLLHAMTDLLLEELLHSSPTRTVRFGDLCQRVTVGVVVKPASHYVEHGVPALRTLNVKPGSLDLTEMVYFSEEANVGALSKSVLKTGDLVVARTGKPGTCAVVPPSLDGANAIDLIIATLDHRVILPEFAQGILNSTVGQRLVLSQSRGQIQKHFNVGALKNAEIPVPEISAQAKFADALKMVDSALSGVRKSAAAADTLFASLQARAFRGEL